MATLQGKAIKNTYRQLLQVGANNIGITSELQPVQDGSGTNTSLEISTGAAVINGDLTITGDLILTGGGLQIKDLIDDTVADLIQNGTGITWAYNDTAATLTPTITIATADGGVQGDYLQFNTAAAEASAVGKLKWNTTDGTMDIGLMGGNVVLQVGQEQVARVLNNSGTNFTEAGYQAVKITSAQGQRLAVGLAQGNSEANSTDTLGLVTENIANNQEGFVTTSGLVREIDTTGDLQSEVWVDGDTLYLSPSVPGGVTKVKPTAPNHVVIVGFVVYAHKNHGKIYVKVDNGYELDELHNVKITSIANGNILQYDSALGYWKNLAGTTTNIAEGTNLYYSQSRFNSAFAAKTTTDLTEGTNLYWTSARGDANFATNFASKTTSNLPEGSNLYFTNARARQALSVTAGTGLSYSDSTGVFSLSAIPNSSLANDSVTINGHSLALGDDLNLTTTDIAEGTNLYWTNTRFDSRFSTKTTTDLTEGTNLYYTQARFNTAFSAKSTTDLAEGTNLYYTDSRARLALSSSATGLTYTNTSGVFSLTSGYEIPTSSKLSQYDTAYNRSIVSAAVSGTSTKTLTLTAQDANTVTASWTDNGITTINGTTNQIAVSTVGNTSTVGFTNDVTFPNNVVVSGNLTINGTATYVDTQSISAKDPLLEVANDNNTTDAVDIGYYGRYYDSTQTRVEFTGLFRDASDAGKFKMFTGLVDEPTNVVDTTGTGYTVATLVANVEGNLAGTANAANTLSTTRSISATGDASWSVNFNGSANATAALTLANSGVTANTYGTSTAVPSITVDAKGRITSASNTNITFPVTTVNGASGTVVLTTSDVAEGSNQYFTTARAQAAITGTAPISISSGVVSITESSTIANGYLSSVNFNIFNDKQNAITGAATTITSTDLTASRALISNSSGKVATSAVTDTELGYVSGVTSAIQTQLDSKQGNITLTTTGSSGSATLVGNTLNVPTYTLVGLGGIGGSGTTNYLSKFTASGTIGNSLIWDNGTNVGIGNTNTTYKFDVTGTGRFTGDVTVGSILQNTYHYFRSYAGTGTQLIGVIGSNNTKNGGYLKIINDDTVSGSRGIRLGINSNGVTPGSGTDVLTVTDTGYVAIGRTSASEILSVNNPFTTLGGLYPLIVSEAGAILGGIYSTYEASSPIGSGLAFKVYKQNVGLTETVRFLNNGNVGIGTSSPSRKLSIESSDIWMSYKVTGAREYLIGMGTSDAFRIFDATADSERMRIASNGRFSLTAAANIGTVLSWTDAQNNTGYLNIRSGAAAVGADNDFYIETAGVKRMTVSQTGNIGAPSGTNIYNASDKRLKKNIESIGYGLNEIINLNPVIFNWLDGFEPTEDDKDMLGFIAQEVQNVIPEAVESFANGNTIEFNDTVVENPLRVNEKFIIPVLVKATKELKLEKDAEIAELKTQIEELKALIAAK